MYSQGAGGPGNVQCTARGLVFQVLLSINKGAGGPLPRHFAVHSQGAGIPGTVRCTAKLLCPRHSLLWCWCTRYCTGDRWLVFPGKSMYRAQAEKSLVF